MARIKHLVAALALATAGTAQAGQIVDFVDLTENTAGESAYNTLTIALAGGTMNVTATEGGNAAFAYLDWGHAGLGVCGSASTTGPRPGLASNVCNPASDDNVTVDEALIFTFTQAVIIDKIWLNNTHDPNPSGQISNPETVLVNGVSTVVSGNGYATGNAYNSQTNLNANAANHLGGYAVAANTPFTLAYGGTLPEQFYVSGMEISFVPAPATVFLLSAGLLGLAARRRRVAR